MLNVNVFCVTSFLCSLEFLLFQLIGHTQRCMQTNIEHFLWFRLCDRTVPPKRLCDMTVPSDRYLY